MPSSRPAIPAVPSLPHCPRYAILPSKPQVLPALSCTGGPQQDPPHQPPSKGRSSWFIRKRHHQPPEVAWMAQKECTVQPCQETCSKHVPLKHHTGTSQERDLQAPLFTPHPRETWPKRCCQVPCSASTIPWAGLRVDMPPAVGRTGCTGGQASPQGCAQRLTPQPDPNRFTNIYLAGF